MQLTPPPPAPTYYVRYYTSHSLIPLRTVLNCSPTPRCFILYCNNMYSGRAQTHNESYFKMFIDRMNHQGLARGVSNIDIDSFNPRAFPDQKHLPAAAVKAGKRDAQSTGITAATKFTDVVRRAVLMHPAVHEDDTTATPTSPGAAAEAESVEISLDDLVESVVDTADAGVSKTSSDVGIRREIVKVLGNDFEVRILFDDREHERTRFQ